MVDFDLSFVLAQFLAYFAYASTLAGALQVAINEIKPLILTPIKEKYGEQVYLVSMYVFRLILTIVGYFTLWGGVEATRALLPSLPANIPDAGIFTVTILLIVLGQEVIHAFADRVYASKKAVDLLKNSVGIPTTTTTTTTTTEPSVTTNDVLREELLG